MGKITATSTINSDQYDWLLSLGVKNFSVGMRLALTIAMSATPEVIEAAKRQAALAEDARKQEKQAARDKIRIARFHARIASEKIRGVYPLSPDKAAAASPDLSVFD